MKSLSRVIWGIVLIGLGVLVALGAFGVIEFELFFKGWWTLFIIIPAFIGIITERQKTFSVVTMCVGIILLLYFRDVINSKGLYGLLITVVIVTAGVKLLFGGVRNGRSRELYAASHKSGKLKFITAVFSGQKYFASGEVFEGAVADAIFGGVDIDLRDAVINGDCVINATAIFGGVDIYIPSNLKVVVNSNSLFGGVENKKLPPDDDAPVHTLYINATCVFGGVDIK